MIDEIREKIDLNKKDRKTYREYIKAFTDSEKAKELFFDNNEFLELSKEEPKEIKKEEDEYF